METELKGKNYEIHELRYKISQLEEKCNSLQDWIDRLLEYTEMSKEDMKTIIQKDKDSAEVMKRMNGLFGIMDIFGSRYL